MRIELSIGNIADQDVDAVVNAANSGLQGGSGVDGALLAAGGDVQREGRRVLARRIGRLPTGQAASSPPGNLKARYLIHVVGPRFGEGTAADLHSCYVQALREADRLGARTVAFPSISTGAYGWPIADAARIAVAAVRGAPAAVETVRFVLYDQRAHDVYATALAEAERVGP